jgi:hypothetical protein
MPLQMVHTQYQQPYSEVDGLATLLKYPVQSAGGCKVRADVQLRLMSAWCPRSGLFLCNAVRPNVASWHALHSACVAMYSSMTRRPLVSALD